VPIAAMPVRPRRRAVNNNKAKVKAVALASAILAVSACPSAIAADDGTSVLTFGAGITSCATWLTDKKTDTDIHGWVLGYWSGLNRLNTRHQVGKSTDAKGVVAEVKKVCTASPTTEIDDAIVAVYIRLGNQEGQH
jgi:hypothetical protein